MFFQRFLISSFEFQISIAFNPNILAMKIKPLNGYAVIKPLKNEEMTKSGIVIPDTANKEKPREGEIVAVSKTNLTSTGTELPIEIKVGDRVLYGQYSGEDVKVDGVEYKIVEMTSIRAIVSDK